MAAGSALLLADELAFAQAREVCRHHAKSFYFASRFLPKAKREAAYALYAFCRTIDDVVDEPGEASATADCQLEQLTQALDAIYSGRLTPPPPGQGDERQQVLYAFARTVETYHIPRHYFEDLAAGCRMDLTQSRYATWADLECYCYRVAGVVGLMMSCIFGLDDPGAQRQAVQMGNAMQLTNILRDVREDWQRGRLYLPQEDLTRFGYTERDVDRCVVDDRFVALMRFEIARARALYNAGASGLRALPDDGSRTTASAMAVIYAGILGAIERAGYDVYSSRARVSTPGKLARIPIALKLARADGQVNDVFN